MSAKKINMNRTRLFALLFIVCLVISIGESAKAASASKDKYEVDASFLYASEPLSGFNNTYGGNFGFGAMLNQAKTLQGRIDYSPLQWEQSPYGLSLNYKRQAVAVSGRYYMSTYSEIVDFFVQLGVEMSFDKKESMSATFLTKTTTSDTNIGITPGIGIEIGFGPSLGFIISGRFHFITDKYYDLGGGLAVHF